MVFTPSPTPEQTAQLKVYAELLRAWNKRINLVSPSTLKDLEKRHLEDCAQLISYFPAPSFHAQKGGVAEKQDTAPRVSQEGEPLSLKVLDVGSGAGLPGLVLAILSPTHSYTLVERDRRKAAFLFTAVQQLGLRHVTVLNDDVNNVKNQYDIITCRAWASLTDIMSQTARFLAPHGHWLLLKGRAFDEELKACGTMFHLTIERWPSIVEGEGWVVRLAPATPVAAT